MTQFFAIAFVGRVGSSYLEALLDSHPDAACKGEVLAALGDISKASPAEVESILERTVHVETGLASGFKLPLGIIATPPGIAGLLDRRGYKLIHITRDNKLDQYISMRLAQENSAWRSDYGSYEKTQLTLDPSDALKAMQIYEDMDAGIREFAKRLPYLHVTYEGIIDGSHLPQVLSFLGLSRSPLSSKYERQRKTSQRDAIENYAELAQALNSAGLDRYLDA